MLQQNAKMNRPAEILVVEDNPGDQRLVLEVFKDVGWATTPHILGNGSEVIPFLKHSPKPDLIILDYNLPGKNAPEILLELKSDSRYSNIPVVVFSVSAETPNVVQSYGVGADCYLKKPMGFDAYYRCLNGLESLWKASLSRKKMFSIQVLYQNFISSLPFSPRKRKDIFEWVVVMGAFSIFWIFFLLKQV